MKGVISLARKDLDNYEVRSKSRMSSSEVNKCIERSQEMISLYDNYLDISTHIYNQFNDEYDDKQWHCMAFSSTGGQSRVSARQYCQLLFGGVLHIEIFNAK